MPEVVYDAVLGYSGSADIILRQIVSSDFDSKKDILAGRESGQPYSAVVGGVAANFVQSSDPMGELTTMDIGGFLTIFGVLGSRLADATKVKIPWVKRSSGSTLKSGSYHALITGTAAADSVTGDVVNLVQLVPQSITVPKMGAVTAQGSVHFLSGDGLTNPITAKTNQAIAAKAFAAMWGNGPIWLNGSRIAKQIGYTVNFGVQLTEKAHYEGCPYPSDCFLETIDPTIEIQVEDFDQISAFETLTDITQFSAFLRRRLEGGTFVADASTAHIKFSLVNGSAYAQARRANETKHGNAALMIKGVSLAVSLTSAVAAP